MRPGRVVLVAVLGCAIAFANACGIDAVGTKPDTSQTLPDGGNTLEVGTPDAASCRSITTNVPGSLVAPKARSPIAIDGDLSEWDACFVPLDRSSAQATRDIGGFGTYQSGEFSVLHDGAKIYVAVRMKKLGEAGSNTDEIYENDSAEIYFDADGQLAQTYGTDTTQIIVDHAGRRQGYRASAKVDTPSSRAAGKTSGDTVTIELEVSPATFGVTSFASSLGFDVAFNDGDGSNQLTQIIWFQKCRKPTCGCADGNDAPYCDGRQFGSLMLAP